MSSVAGVTAGMTPHERSSCRATSGEVVTPRMGAPGRSRAMSRALAPEAEVSCSGKPFPFPPDLDDGPLRAHVGDYPSVSVADGVRDTLRAFRALVAEGRLDPALIQ